MRPVNGHIQVGLTENAEDPEIGDSLDLPHDLDDRVRFVLQGLQIVAINFRGKLPLYAADCLLHVVGDRLREVPENTRHLLEFFVHRRDQFILVLVKRGAPLFLGFQADIEFDV